MSVINPWYQLGYIIPHIYTDMDAYQFYRVAPEGMMLVTTGFNLAGHSLEAFEQELPTFWRCVDTLATKQVDRIALSGVPVASVVGRKRMLDILAEAQQRTGIACDTDLEAHIAALQHFGATKIALATRWPESTIVALKRYLGEAGIEVLATRSHAMSFAVSKSFRAAEDHLLALELGGQVLRETPQAQALLMPGGLWHAMHAVPILETEYGRPVLLNITSTTRAALVAAGDRVAVRPDPRWGMVLASV